MDIIPTVSKKHQVMINIKSLSIGYKSGNKINHVVAKDLSMTLNQGQLVFLIGPNGSGKSTLINTLCGFHYALSGKIMIDEKNLNLLMPIELSKLICVVQSTAPNVENFTVRDMVAFGRYPYSNIFGRLQDSDYKIVDEAITTIGIEKLNGSLYNMISDGEKQKTMIAKALAQCSPYIVMDEPMAFLDYESRIEMIDLLVDMTKSHDRGILISTHNLEMALHSADMLWIFDRNSNFYVVTPDDLFEKQLIGKLFDFRTASYLNDIYNRR